MDRDGTTAHGEGSGADRPAEPASGRGWRFTVRILALLVAIVFGGIGVREIYRAARESRATEPAIVAPVTVRYHEVALRPLRDVYRATGFLAPLETIRLSAETAGRVVEKPRSEGDSVESGALIIRVDDSRYRSALAAAQARRAGLAAELRYQQKELDRTRTLVERESLNPAELDRLQSAVERLEAQILESDAVIAESCREIERCLVRAPREAVIFRDLAEVGEYLSPGAPVAELRVVDPLELEVEVPASVRQALVTGTEVEVELEDIDPVLHDMPASVPGRLVRLPVGTRDISRRFPVVFEIESREGRLVPGLFASVSIETRSTERMLTVPRSGVRKRYGQYWVFVITKSSEGSENLVVLEREIGVEPVARRPAEWRVTRGLVAGERLVIHPLDEVKHGTRVQLAPVLSAAAPEPGDSETGN